MNPAPRHTKKFDTAITVAALGVVFGDIGTSPLYAFKTCFSTAAVGPSPENVLGILSLVLWALILVVCVKYIGFVMRVDHDGEGGILALLALVLPPPRKPVPRPTKWLTLVVIVGAGMLFGDGVITPAISVISAVEGLNVATSAAQPLVVPITLVVVVGLFALQSRGTERVGKLFGPVMAAWFLAIAIAGIMPIVRDPAILRAFDPRHASHFLTHHGPFGFLVLGAVVLCVTGVEALYADLSHFGRKPITIGWFALVLPALVLNYVGQGAYVLVNPKALDNPFYALVGGPMLLPMVALATAATVIASQALISGAFTLTEQAIALALAPRVEVIHTSNRYPGQVYVPSVNVLLAVACAALIVGFQSSDRLAAAYGLAVAVTMAATSIAYGAAVHAQRGWPAWRAAAITAAFLLMDGSFVIAGLPKFAAGGWLPVVICGALSVMATTWLEGRRRLTAALAAQSTPVEAFAAGMRSGGALSNGHAVLLTGDPTSVPYLERHTWLCEHMAHERIVLLTVVPAHVPRIPDDERVRIDRVAPRLTRVTAYFGYTEPPRIEAIVHACAAAGLHLDDPATSYFVAGPRVVRVRKAHGMPAWRRALFAFLLRLSRPLTFDLGISADQLVELGLEVPL